MAAAPKKRSRKKHRKYMTTEEAIRHVLHPKDMCCIRRTCAASEGHVLHPNDMCCIRRTCAASEFCKYLGKKVEILNSEPVRKG
jgi:hypothetical protein